MARWPAQVTFAAQKPSPQFLHGLRWRLRIEIAQAPAFGPCSWLTLGMCATCLTNIAATEMDHRSPQATPPQNQKWDGPLRITCRGTYEWLNNESLSWDNACSSRGKKRCYCQVLQRTKPGECDFDLWHLSKVASYGKSQASTHPQMFLSSNVNSLLVPSAIVVPAGRRCWYLPAGLMVLHLAANG